MTKFIYIPKHKTAVFMLYKVIVTYSEVEYALQHVSISQKY